MDQRKAFNIEGILVADMGEAAILVARKAIEAGVSPERWWRDSHKRWHKEHGRPKGFTYRQAAVARIAATLIRRGEV